MYVRNCYSRLFQSIFMLLMLDILILQSAKIIENGPLHFNFVSDPCLPETIELNWKCIEYALSHQDNIASQTSVQSIKSVQSVFLEIKNEK